MITVVYIFFTTICFYYFSFIIFCYIIQTSLHANQFYQYPGNTSSLTVNISQEMAMKAYLYSMFVLTACLSFCYAGYDAKTQEERDALKELVASIMAEEEADAKAASLAFKEQDDDGDTLQQQQEDDGDSVEAQQDTDDYESLKLIKQQLHEDLFKEQQDGAIVHEEQVDGDESQHSRRMKN